MEAIEKFEIEIVFNNINYLILNKSTKISANSYFYLEKSIFFFNSLIKSLDSLDSGPVTSDLRDNYYSFFPSLKEVVSSVPNTSVNISKVDIINMKKYFTEIINDINNLKTNPDRFYRSKKSAELMNFAEKMKMIYSEDFQSHIFETEETFSNAFHYAR
jgi:hypothetical protein